jgi:hypothetical protein
MSAFSQKKVYDTKSSSAFDKNRPALYCRRVNSAIFTPTTREGHVEIDASLYAPTRLEFGA